MTLKPWAAWSVSLVLALGGCTKKQEAFEVFEGPKSAGLQRYWQLPEFSLVERSGLTVSAAALRGKVWVADFFYTSCPGPCPMLSSRLSALHKAVSGLEGVVLVSISTDPVKDTPDVLKQYAAKFGADDKWLFLTGDKPAIYSLANNGFKLGVSDEGGTVKEPVTHSTKLVLVDKNGVVRNFYDGLAEGETARMVDDIKSLLKETR